MPIRSCGGATLERAQVQLFGTAPVVDHSRLCAQLARVGLTHVCLTIGSSLGLVVGGCDGLPERENGSTGRVEGFTLRVAGLRGTAGSTG